MDTRDGKKVESERLTANDSDSQAYGKSSNTKADAHPKNNLFES